MLALRRRITEEAASAEQHWICRYRASGSVAYDYRVESLRLWFTCAYVALQMFGGGTGTIGPNNFTEDVVVLLGVIAGTMLWAIFVGQVCSIQTNIDAAEQQCAPPLRARARRRRARHARARSACACARWPGRA